MPPILSEPSKIEESTIDFKEKKVIFIWSFTCLLVVMNTTMFNVALPFLLKDLSLNSSMGSWLVSGYSIMFAISSLTFGRLSDFVPLSRLLLSGICILVTSSVIGFFSTNFYILLGVRIFQAAGAGAVMGLSMIMARRYIPLSRRGKAMAFIASAASLAFGLGPVVGGMITQYLGWNYLFFVTIFSVLSIPFFLKFLPPEVIKKGRFDLFGAIITGLSVTALLLFLSTFSFWFLLTTVALFIIWWFYINKKEDAFIPPILLKNKQYTKLVFINCSAFFINFSNLFLMPIILTTVFGKELAELGMIIFPGAVIAMVSGIYIGKFIDRFGNAPLIILGQVLLFIASLLFAFLSTINPYFILFIYMFASVGFTSISSSISNEITRILPINQIGSGTGIGQLMQFIGAGLGVTITGLLITLQESLSFNVIYRNIFICFSIIIIFTSFIYSLYIKSAKVEQN